jgi:hypothetical protein
VEPVTTERLTDARLAQLRSDLDEHGTWVVGTWDAREIVAMLEEVEAARSARLPGDAPDLRDAAQAVVDAYRAMREAGSFSGFWTHIDDLAKALARLPGDADAAKALPTDPPPLRAVRRHLPADRHEEGRTTVGDYWASPWARAEAERRLGSPVDLCPTCKGWECLDCNLFGWVPAAATPPSPKDAPLCKTCGDTGWVATADCIEPGIYAPSGEPCPDCDGPPSPKDADEAPPTEPGDDDPERKE